MIRLNIIVEGQTEETFVRDVLAPHLSMHGVFARARRVLTSQKKGARGGMTRYEKAKRDIQNWIKQEPDAWLTTMFDFYALPSDFPGYIEAQKLIDPYQKVRKVEEGLKDDINAWKFIPYIQLHEFEAYLFADPPKIGSYFFEYQNSITALQEIRKQFPSPEYINLGSETAPSKRICRVIPQYCALKSTAGPIIAGGIGLDKIREECRHFDEWINDWRS